MITNINERKSKIVQLVCQKTTVSVAEICDELGVSPVTVRSDLEELSEMGYLHRTHGGAIAAFNQGILDRQRLMVEEKDRIARAAADMVNNGDHIMIVAGTTTSLIPKFLMGKSDIHIVTNSTFLLPFVRMHPSLHVTIVGGKFLPSAEAMVGPIAVGQLKQFHVSRAFLGTDGFSIGKGFSAHQVEVAEVVKAMAGQADESILCADSSKYGKTGFAHILPLSEVDQVITDEGIGRNHRRTLEENDISVLTV